MGGLSGVLAACRGTRCGDPAGFGGMRETDAMQLTDTDVVLVTGGASGLGAATVESALAAGARAVIIDLPDAVAALDRGSG